VKPGAAPHLEGEHVADGAAEDDVRHGEGVPEEERAARVTVARPIAGDATRSDVYPVNVYLGLRENFVSIFESSDELNAGRWSFEVTLFSAAAPREYPFRGTLEPMKRWLHSAQNSSSSSPEAFIARVRCHSRLWQPHSASRSCQAGQGPVRLHARGRELLRRHDSKYAYRSLESAGNRLGEAQAPPRAASRLRSQEAGSC